jgi:hypothetical protein
MASQSASLSPHQRQLLGFSTLLQLQNQARQAKNSAELAFLMVNETVSLLRYRQAVLCRKKASGGPVVEAVSGVDRPNRDAPYIIWVKQLFKHLLKKEKQVKAVTGEELPKALQKGWQEWRTNGLWCPLVAADGEMLGGLWLVRDTPWQEGEKKLLAQLTGVYAHAWQALLHRSTWRRHRRKKGLGRLARFLLLCGAAASLALPVPLTVLAPAQMVPVEPMIVTSPLKGVVKKFHLTPYQEVAAGQPLFSLDETELRNRNEVADKALAVATAEYQRARQKSLIDKDTSLDITILKARVAQKEAERSAVADELGRVTVLAARPGIALFSDVNDWQGKPVVVGEKVLTLADPGQTEVEIQVPMDNAVNLEQGAQVRIFLNTDPSLKIRALIRQTSYEAVAGSDGILAYRVKATLVEGRDQVRIGQHGTAKIYGRQTRLFYYLFRRPWAAARKTLGL